MPLNMGVSKSFLRETGFEVKEASQRAPKAWPCESRERLLVKVQPRYGGDTSVSRDATAVGQFSMRAAAYAQWLGLEPTRQALCAGDDEA